MSAAGRSEALRWLALLGMLAAFILVPFAIGGEAIDAWVDGRAWSAEAPAVAGAVLAVLLALDVILPTPSSAVSTLLGAVLGAVGGTAVGALAMTVGCLIGYLLGRRAGPGVRRLLKPDEADRAAAWLERHGVLALALCRAVPVLAEASVIMAGALRLPLRRVLGVTALANVGLSAVYASIGAAAAGGWSFLLAFAAAVALPGLFMAIAAVRQRVVDAP